MSTPAEATGSSRSLLTLARAAVPVLLGLPGVRALDRARRSPGRPSGSTSSPPASGTRSPDKFGALPADLRHPALLVPRPAHRRAALARRRDLPHRVRPAQPAPADRHRDRAARRDPERGVRPVGHLRADPVPARVTSSRSSRDAFGFLPFFEGPIYGPSMLSASIILAIMVMPYVMSVSREVLLAVPGSQREAALALGATRWEAVVTAVVPVRPLRHHRRDHPRAGPRAGRDDGRHDADRQPARDRRLALRPGLHHGRRDRQRVRRGGDRRCTSRR